MRLRDDYSSAFEAGLDLSGFSRQLLARLGREYLLNGHLQDRVGLPLVAKRYGQDDQVRFSIEEWMGASPIYSQRMQRALGFEGDGVETVFKNLQLDIGAPPQFMDFQFRLDSPEYGEFWLPHCGALLDIEPFGEKQVELMCHDIEDPTFDATAAAAHPCMKMRAIHRPPREERDRIPHCRWSVFIDSEEGPGKVHPNLEIVARSKLANLPVDILAAEEDASERAEAGGWRDYSGAFAPEFQLEDLSHRALVAVNEEFALQSHLLARAFMLAVSQQADEATAGRLGASQWTGIAALTAGRLLSLLEIADRDIQAIAKIFQLHPAFRPRAYLDFCVEVIGPYSARLSLYDCPALEEEDAHSWFSALESSPHPALDAIAGAVNPRAACHPVADAGAARFAWDVVIDPAARPREDPEELRLARLSGGATFEFESRRMPCD